MEGMIREGMKRGEKSVRREREKEIRTGGKGGIGGRGNERNETRRMGAKSASATAEGNREYFSGKKMRHT